MLIQTILIQPTLPLIYCHPPPNYPHVKLQLWDFKGGGEVIGEDSWIMGLSFVTLYFHSFATEER